MELHEKLKYYRKNLNLTQQQVADALGIKRSAYAYYETGKSMPKLPVLKLIAKLYNLSLDMLLDNLFNDTEEFKLNSNNDYLQRWMPNDKFNQLTEFEQTVLLRVRLMSADEKEQLLSYLEK